MIEIIKEEFIENLIDGEYVHTFVNTSFGLMGADWKREEVLKELDNCIRFGMAGEQALRMGHGLFMETEPNYIVFFETKKP